MFFNQKFSSNIINNDLIDAAQQAYNQVMSDHLPVLELPYDTDLIKEFESVGEYYREQFKTVVILGTGGSSLGGQSLVALAQDAYGFKMNGPRLVFLDNIDPDTFDRFLSQVDFQSTGFIAISKSGNTAETTCQVLSIIDHWNKISSTLQLSDHFLVITEEKDSTLSKLAADFNLPTIEHNRHIGGRFAALSVVGLLPAMIAGLNPRLILEGAKDVLDQQLEGTYISGSAWSVATEKPLTVMMPYCDRLQLFCKWWRQLWAESLGKDGRGITPIAAYGTVDQHSQLQLYLDGPKDKAFTFLTTHHTGKGHPICSGSTELKGHTIGDLMQAEQQATIETLQRKGCALRTIDIPEVNEQAVGALMMHFMLETMITARLLEVNAFDQPAVEEGKILAMQYLKQDRAA